MSCATSVNAPASSDISSNAGHSSPAPPSSPLLTSPSAMAEIEKGPVQAASNQETTDLIARLRTLQDSIPQDEELRKELYSTVRNLSLALESPIDTVKRICYLPIQLAMTKVAIDLGIFGVLNRPMSTVELETEVKSDAILLKRVLQYLASVGIIQRDGSDTFSPTKIARTLSIPGFQAAIRHHYEVHLPAWAALASFLADTSYANPSDEKKTAFQVAHHTDLPAYRWALTQPRLSRDFQLWMQAQRVGEKTWLDVVPRQYITAEGENAQPLFVDIGGGVGHQCAALLAAFPSVGRRVILQDLAPAIAHALPTPGVERVAHDFWEEQPIKGASVYYLRNVLHNYPDEKCITLLENTTEAMSPASVIFIDEIVLSDQQVHWQAAQLDITMMASLGAMERTRAQWLSLLDQAGLVVEEILRYTDEAAESLIIAVVK